MIRNIKQKDFEQVYAIYMSPSVNQYMGFERMSQSEFLPLFNDFLHNSEFIAWDKNGECVAVMRLLKGARRGSHRVRLASLGVHESVQGQGIGKAFLIEIIGQLKVDGFKRIELSVESDNPNALALYKKLGFQVEGVMMQYLKRAADGYYVDDYMMAMCF